MGKKDFPLPAFGPLDPRPALPEGTLSGWRPHSATLGGGAGPGCAYNSPAQFETPVAAGALGVWQNVNLRSGDTRRASCAIQVRFKERTPFAEVLVGPLAPGPLVELSFGKMIYNMAVALWKKLFFPLLNEDLYGDKPYFAVPLVLAPDYVSVHKAGEAPDLTGELPLEDMRLVDGEKFKQDFANCKSKQRKAFFAKEANLSNFCFEPDLVYTFVFTTNMLIMDSPKGFEYSVKNIMSWNLSKHAHSLPLTLGAWVKSSTNWVFGLELWHQYQLNPPPLKK